MKQYIEDLLVFLPLSEAQKQLLISGLDVYLLQKIQYLIDNAPDIYNLTDP
jgi:hypothetical protein